MPRSALPRSPYALPLAQRAWRRIRIALIFAAILAGFWLLDRFFDARTVDWGGPDEWERF